MPGVGFLEVLYKKKDRHDFDTIGFCFNPYQTVHSIKSYSYLMTTLVTQIFKKQLFVKEWRLDSLNIRKCGIVNPYNNNYQDSLRPLTPSFFEI